MSLAEDRTKGGYRMTWDHREIQGFWAKFGSDTLTTYSPHTGAADHPTAHGSGQAAAQGRVLVPEAKTGPAGVPGFSENCPQETVPVQTWGSPGSPVLTSPHGLGPLE